MKIGMIKDRPSRRLLMYFMLMLAVLVGMNMTPSGIASAEAAVSGEVKGSDTSTIQRPDGGYGKPNLSRIWYNSRQNRWDGLVPQNDGGTSASDHYIMKDVNNPPPGGQTFTTVELEDRNTARPDIFWGDTNRKLYVLGSHAKISKFWQVDYNHVADSYSINPNVNGVTVTGITHPGTPTSGTGGNRPASLYVSPNGGVWVAVMKDGYLDVQHSNDDGETWMTSPITLDNLVGVGVTTWIDFVDQGTTYVGVFAGENGEEFSSSSFYFWYIDQNVKPAVLLNWVDDSANIPGPVGSEMADDHVSAARDQDGYQYFAVKTEGGIGSDPLINLYQRSAGGKWNQFTVTTSNETPEQTRPSIVIDTENSEIYVYTTDTGGGDGNRIKAGLGALDDLVSAEIKTLFSNNDGPFDDVISPQHTVDSNSGVVVLAHNTTDKTVWYSAEEISPITVFETVLDDFNTSSFNNNDGTLDWAGPWLEVDGAGTGPTRGNVLITRGKLSLDDRPNTGGQPSLQREANLFGFTSAILSFSFRTTGGVDSSDSVVVEVSDNGGASWTVLEVFTGITGSTSGNRSFDISIFIAANTRVRFRVNNLYGGYNEHFLVDFVEIALEGDGEGDGEGDLVPVPNVVGLPQTQAETAIVTAGLSVRDVIGVNSNTVPAGRVIRQNPRNLETIRDNFSSRSFGNNNGTLDWDGDWIEVDGAGSGPRSGNVQITLGGELSLDDRPNTGGDPSLEREVNLLDIVDFTSSVLLFNYRTTGGVDKNDSVVVEISDNGGTSWTVLENFTGISGSTSGSRNFDVSAFVSDNTRIRFRVNNLYGGSNELFRVDNVRILLSGILVPAGAEVDLVVSLGPVPGDDDDDDDDDDDGDGD